MVLGGGKGLSADLAFVVPTGHKGLDHHYQPGHDGHRVLLWIIIGVEMVLVKGY